MDDWPERRRADPSLRMLHPEPSYIDGVRDRDRIPQVEDWYWSEDGGRKALRYEFWSEPPGTEIRDLSAKKLEFLYSLYGHTAMPLGLAVSKYYDRLWRQRWWDVRVPFGDTYRDLKMSEIQDRGWMVWILHSSNYKAQMCRRTALQMWLDHEEEDEDPDLDEDDAHSAGEQAEGEPSESSDDDDGSQPHIEPLQREDLCRHYDGNLRAPCTPPPDHQSIHCVPMEGDIASGYATPPPPSPVTPRTGRRERRIDSRSGESDNEAEISIASGPRRKLRKCPLSMASPSHPHISAFQAANRSRRGVPEVLLEAGSNLNKALELLRTSSAHELAECRPTSAKFVHWEVAQTSKDVDSLGRGCSSRRPSRYDDTKRDDHVRISSLTRTPGTPKRGRPRQSPESQDDADEPDMQGSPPKRQRRTPVSKGKPHLHSPSRMAKKVGLVG
ncbi:hypothetical protein PQX77_000287 [Marasmius sp. AFHP31]|nr:hypothetical protein PQX77_000287 [Marasmius sp. AFHP31]